MLTSACVGEEVAASTVVAAKELPTAQAGRSAPTRGRRRRGGAPHRVAA